MIWYLLHSKTLQACKFLCGQTNSFHAVMSALNYISFLNEWSVVNCIKIYIFLEDVFSFQRIYAIPILFIRSCVELSRRWFLRDAYKELKEKYI